MGTERIEERLEVLAERQAEMNASLRDHMRRTAAAEANIEILRGQIKPIEQHVAVFGALGKLLGLGVAVGGLIVGILRLFA